jgi:hypothetical protein
MTSIVPDPITRWGPVKLSTILFGVFNGRQINVDVLQAKHGFPFCDDPTYGSINTF